MLINYLKISFRNLSRQRGFSLINIFGLSIGLMVSLLIFLWVQDEMKIDQFHQNSDRLYRVLSKLDNGEAGILTWENSPYPLLDYLPDNYPEIEDIAAYDPTNKKQFEVKENRYLADGIFATTGFFRLLNFPFTEGHPNTIFEEPNAVVISESLAAKLLGSDWKGLAIGETVTINGRPDYIITGVFAEISKQSSLQFDFALNLEEQHQSASNSFPWGNFDSRIILKIKEESSAEIVEHKIADAVKKNNEHAQDTDLILQPFARMYLYGQFENGKEAGGRIEYVRLFGLAALFLLLIACINFMNLATARASKRAKEVGVRKTIGASRRSLVYQFMTEATLITFISITLAVILGELMLPWFKVLSGKELFYNYQSPEFWMLIVGIGVVTALLAGSYPSFFLSSFKIANVLKGKLSYNFGGSHLRRALVVFQFVLSALLLVSALVVRNQINFIKTKHLGLDKENVLYFRTPPGADEKRETFKSELLSVPGIKQLTFASSNPLSVGAQTGDPKWEGMAPGAGMLFHVLVTDHNFLKTMNIPIASGRDFSPLLSTDTMTFLINETAANAMKLNNPLGKQLEFWGIGGPVIGVVKDFHIGSLHETIGPLIIANVPGETGLTILRIDPNRTEEIIAASQTIFHKFSEGFPFRYDFLDERYFQKYRSEQQTGALAGWFALVALVISCLGLFGLAAFIAEQKTKEIGIRKVLGATVVHIVSMLSKEFLKLVLVALMIALPLGWYLMNKWLGDFAYRIDLTWKIFALAGALAIAVALLTVSFQSLKAALANPIESLRSE